MKSLTLNAKLYISGPMTGYTDFNRENFNRMSWRVRELGYAAINPVDLDLVEPSKDGWTNYLRRDIKYLVACDGVVLLTGWENSKGAKLETYIAHQLEMPFYVMDGVNGLKEVYPFSEPRCSVITEDFSNPKGHCSIIKDDLDMTIIDHRVVKDIKLV